MRLSAGSMTPGTKLTASCSSIDLDHLQRWLTARKPPTQDVAWGTQPRLERDLIGFSLCTQTLRSTCSATSSHPAHMTCKLCGCRPTAIKTQKKKNEKKKKKNMVGHEGCTSQPCSDIALLTPGRRLVPAQWCPISLSPKHRDR